MFYLTVPWSGFSVVSKRAVWSFTCSTKKHF